MVWRTCVQTSRHESRHTLRCGRRGSLIVTSFSCAHTRARTHTHTKTHTHTREQVGGKDRQSKGMSATLKVQTPAILLRSALATLHGSGAACTLLMLSTLAPTMSESCHCSDCNHPKPPSLRQGHWQLSLASIALGCQVRRAK